MLKYLQPLPVSEEMLGAYLEGNLSAEEVSYVESFLQTDMNLKELVEEVGEINADDALSDFELPEVNPRLIDDEWEDIGGQGLTDLDGIYDGTETESAYEDLQTLGLNDETFDL